MGSVRRSPDQASLCVAPDVRAYRRAAPMTTFDTVPTQNGPTAPQVPVLFDELLPLLQSAEEGSRRLDLMIAFAMGRGSIDSRTVLHILLQNEASPDRLAELIDHDCPNYTTSLDAELPGENIVLSLYQPTQSAWTAVHRSDAGDVIGSGASEILARRVAVLKASLVSATGDRAETGRRAPPAPPAGAPAAGSTLTMPDPEIMQPGRGRSDPAEETDWEILW